MIGAPIFMRETKKIRFSILAITFALLAGAMPAHGQSDKQPNIIVVMADDHAQWALGAYGLDQIDTPNIDFTLDERLFLWFADGFESMDESAWSSGFGNLSVVDGAGSK